MNTSIKNKIVDFREHKWSIYFYPVSNKVSSIGTKQKNTPVTDVSL